MVLGDWGAVSGVWGLEFLRTYLAFDLIVATEETLVNHSRVERRNLQAV